MEVFASVTAGATTPTGGTTGSLRISLPTGFTIDTTKINSATANESVLGTWQGSLTGTGNIGGQIRKHTSNLQVELWRVATASGDNNPYDTVSASYMTNGGTVVGKAFAHFTVPIAEWAGSGTVNVAQNDVEYAYNSSTSTTTNDTTSFAYGPQGALIQNINVSNALTRRVRFQTPIRSGDDVVVEFSTDGTKWFKPYAGVVIESYTYNGATSQAGIGLGGYTGNTDVDVVFGQSPTNGFTGPWGATLGGYYWRVKKSSAGAAVGFGIVSETSSGLMPSANTNLDNAAATRLGLKQYLHGTSYNGGNAPTVSGTGYTNSRSVFIPYQMQDGTWRLKFNIYGNVSSSSRTSYTVSINGVTFKSGHKQSISGSSLDAGTGINPGNAYAETTTLYVYHSTFTTDRYGFSGDVELESKPTWAY
jgi:hypothetical protein